MTNRLRRVLAEERLQEVVERALEVAERDALVDGEALDLVEGRRVRRVGRVPPVDAAERDDVDGRLLRLHRPDLRRRRLGAEHRLVVEEERLQRRPRRVPRREVERVEVVARRLDLPAVDDRVAEPEEDVLDLAPDLRDEVEVPAPDRARRACVTSTRSSVSRRSSSARSSSASRASIAASSRSRSAFSAMPVSRSRTSRSASFSSLFRPRYSTRDLLDLVDRRGRIDSCEGGVLECLGVHGSAEVTNARASLQLATRPWSLSPRRAARVTPCTLALVSGYEAFARLRRVGGRHDGGRRLLRRARARGGRSGRRARGRDGPGRDPDRRAHREAGDRIDLSRRCSRSPERAAEAGVELELREARHARPRLRGGDAISSSARIARSSIFRPGPTGGASSSASPARSGPAGASRGTPSSSTIATPRTRDGKWHDEPLRHLRRVRAGRQPRRHRARGRRRRSRSGGSRAPNGKVCSTCRPRDRGALRLVRPPPVRRREPRVRLGRAQAG